MRTLEDKAIMEIQTVFAIEPAWRGYDYFMVGDQIVIVDPRSMEIVAILEV